MDFQWKFGSSMDLHQVFGAVFDNCTLWQVIYNSHLRIRLGNCSSPDQSFGVQMFGRHRHH